MKVPQIWAAHNLKSANKSAISDILCNSTLLDCLSEIIGMRLSTITFFYNLNDSKTMCCSVFETCIVSFKFQHALKA